MKRPLVDEGAAGGVGLQALYRATVTRLANTNDSAAGQQGSADSEENAIHSLNCRLAGIATRRLKPVLGPHAFVAMQHSELTRVVDAIAFDETTRPLLYDLFVAPGGAQTLLLQHGMRRCAAENFFGSMDHLGAAHASLPALQDILPRLVKMVLENEPTHEDFLVGVRGLDQLAMSASEGSAVYVMSFLTELMWRTPSHKNSAAVECLRRRFYNTLGKAHPIVAESLLFTPSSMLWHISAGRSFHRTQLPGANDPTPPSAGARSGNLPAVPPQQPAAEELDEEPQAKRDEDEDDAIFSDPAFFESSLEPTGEALPTMDMDVGLVDPGHSNPEASPPRRSDEALPLQLAVLAEVAGRRYRLDSVYSSPEAIQKVTMAHREVLMGLADPGWASKPEEALHHLRLAIGCSSTVERGQLVDLYGEIRERTDADSSRGSGFGGLRAAILERLALMEASDDAAAKLRKCSAVEAKATDPLLIASEVLEHAEKVEEELRKFDSGVPRSFSRPSYFSGEAGSGSAAPTAGASAPDGSHNVSIPVGVVVRGGAIVRGIDAVSAVDPHPLWDERALRQASKAMSTSRSTTAALLALDHLTSIVAVSLQRVSESFARSITENVQESKVADNATVFGCTADDIDCVSAALSSVPALLRAHTGLVGPAMQLVGLVAAFQPAAVFGDVEAADGLTARAHKVAVQAIIGCLSPAKDPIRPAGDEEKEGQQRSLLQQAADMAAMSEQKATLRSGLAIAVVAHLSDMRRGPDRGGSSCLPFIDYALSDTFLRTRCKPVILQHLHWEAVDVWCAFLTAGPSPPFSAPAAAALIALIYAIKPLLPSKFEESVRRLCRSCAVSIVGKTKNPRSGEGEDEQLPHSPFGEEALGFLARFARWKPRP